MEQFIRENAGCFGFLTALVLISVAVWAHSWRPNPPFTSPLKIASMRLVRAVTNGYMAVWLAATVVVFVVGFAALIIACVMGLLGKTLPWWWT